MADPVSWIMIGSTILSATGAISGGIAQNQAAKYTAAQEVQAGNAAAATGQRKAFDERRQGNLISSRAQAVAAASGAGATDPTVLDIQGRIAGQTDYNAMSALYEGASAEQNYGKEAALTRFEGGQAETAGFLKGGATLLSGGASLYDKYGGGGFASFNPASGNWTPGREGFPAAGYG